MSGMADSIRERRAREFQEWKEGDENEAIGEVEDSMKFLEEWEENEEWEDEEDEWDEWEEEENEWEDEEWKEPLSEKLKTVFKKALGPLVDFIVDTAAIVAIPTIVALSMIALFKTTALVEVYLAAGAATLITILVSDDKTRLLRRLQLS
jgi:hypothetical protein